MTAYERLTTVSERFLRKHQDTKSDWDQQIAGKLQQLAEQCANIQDDISDIQQMTEACEKISQIPFNGYQSFVECFHRAVDSAISDCENVRSSIVWWRGISPGKLLGNLELCRKWLCSYGKLLPYVKQMNTVCNPGSLRPNPEDMARANVLWEKCANIEATDFAGRLPWLQFSPNLRSIFRNISTATAIYSHYFFATGGTLRRLFNVFKSIWKITFRSGYLETVTFQYHQYGGIDSLKACWSILISDCVVTINRVLKPTFISVNETIGLTPKTLSLQSTANADKLFVPPPRHSFDEIAVRCRLLSSKRRSRMIYSRWTFAKKHQSSPLLIFHCHGGGFVCQSSKDQGGLLRNWAQKTDAPIFSVDYSLAPEAPFPQACEEVFYAYCWALKHCHRLGSTAEHVVLVGDSAGAHMVTSVVMEAIQRGVRKPDGLFLIYPILNVGVFSTPSRLLGPLTPCLSIREIYYCLDAYASVDESRSQCSQPSRTASDDQPDFILNPVEQRSRYSVANCDLSTLAATTRSKPVADLQLKVDQRLDTTTAPDELLSLFPRTEIVACRIDPLLDDSVIMAARLEKLHVTVRLTVMDNEPHGFLGLADANQSSKESAMQVVGILKKLLGDN